MVEIVCCRYVIEFKIKKGLRTVLKTKRCPNSVKMDGLCTIHFRKVYREGYSGGK